VRERREGVTDSGEALGGPWAENWLGPVWCPRPSFIYFLFFPFSFLDFCFFYDFCKTTLNKPKQNPKIF
jgi:hypothetical protein